MGQPSTNDARRPIPSRRFFTSKLQRSRSFIARSKSASPKLIYSFILLQLCVIFYPIARFASKPLSLSILLAVVLISARTLILNKRAAFRFLKMAPGHLILITAIILALGENNTVATTYLVFLLLYLLLASVIVDLQFKQDSWIPVYGGLLVALLIVAFANSEWLQHLRGEDFFGIDLPNPSMGDLRQRAFFLHSNDMGIYCAGLAILCLRSSSSGWQLTCLRWAAVVALLWCTILSDSTTGEFAFAAGWVLTFIPVTWGLASLALLFSAAFVSQMFFAAEVASYLQGGSFWWRYAMASDVANASKAISFNPVSITGQASWTHSLILDSRLMFGTLPTIGLFILFMMAIKSLSRPTAAGLLIVALCAVVQPAGAMPASFMMLAFGMLVATTPQVKTAAV